MDAHDPRATPPEPTEEEKAADLDNYDLDGDGKVSLKEDLQAELGLVDARLEEIAETEHGLKAKLAGTVHKIVDKFDND